MRVRHFPISCEAVAAMLTTGREHALRVASGFPEDARVRGAFTEGDTVVIVVESRSFEDVPMAHTPPVRSILLENRLPVSKPARVRVIAAAASSGPLKP